MTFVYIGIGSIAFLLLLLWGLDKYSRKGKTVDIAADLRELLIAKAEGRISPEEYASQEALLHAAVLQGTAAHKASVLDLATLRWLVPVVLAIVGAAFWAGSSRDAEKPVAPSEFAKPLGA